MNDKPRIYLRRYSKDFAAWMVTTRPPGYNPALEVKYQRAWKLAHKLNAMRMGYF